MAHIFSNGLGWLVSLGKYEKNWLGNKMYKKFWFGLKNLFNRALENVILPGKLKLADIIPIFKNGD